MGQIINAHVESPAPAPTARGGTRQGVPISPRQFKLTDNLRTRLPPDAALREIIQKSAWLRFTRDTRNTSNRVGTGTKKGQRVVERLSKHNSVRPDPSADPAKSKRSAKRLRWRRVMCTERITRASAARMLASCPPSGRHEGAMALKSFPEERDKGRTTAPSRLPAILGQKIIRDGV